MTKQQQEQEQAAQDQAIHKAPIYVVGGCLVGLLAGTIFGNIAYGVCAGVLLAIAAWLISRPTAARKGQDGEIPPADA